MILIEKTIKVTPWTLTRSATNMWTACTVRFEGADLLISTAYLPPDDDMTNLKTMQELAHMVGQARCPYLIGGDFNCPPEGLNQYHYDGLVNCEVMVPRNSPTTCHMGARGSLIDYGLASGHMAHIIDDVQVCWDTPTRPHAGVLYCLSKMPQHIWTRQVMRPKQIDLPTGLGWTWDRCQQFADRLYPRKSREPLAQQKEYARQTGTEDAARTMSVLYSKWSLAVEAQILSRTEED